MNSPIRTGERPTAGKTFTFRARPEYASYLLDMGADLVSLANNHAYDYGEISLLDSLDTLEGIGIPYVGAGRNFEEASEPVYMEANGLTIAFVAATQIERMPSPDTKGATETSAGVFRCLEIDGRFWRSVAGGEGKAAILPLLFVHWGTGGPHELDHWQLEQAPQIAEAGADLIIGAHPHVLQPVGILRHCAGGVQSGKFSVQFPDVRYLYCGGCGRMKMD